MTREMLKEELGKRGLKFIEKEVVKNGEMLHAFEFETKEKDGYGVAVLLYPDELIAIAEMRGDKMDRVVDEIIEAVSDENIPKEISSFLNKEDILKHLYIEVEKVFRATEAYRSSKAEKENKFSFFIEKSRTSEK